jgi:hypothetical protein
MFVVVLEHLYTNKTIMLKKIKIDGVMILVKIIITQNG